MTKLELLHVFLNDRLTAVAEEIFRAIKDTFVQFQSEIRRSKEENERLKRLLNVAVQRLLLQPEACAVQSQDHDDIHDSARVSGVQVKKEPRLGDVHSGCMHDGGRDPEKDSCGPFETQSRLVQTLCCSDTVSPSPLPLPLPFKETEWENEGHFTASSSSSSTRALHSDTRGGGGGGGATAENSYGSVQKDLSGSLAQQVTGLPCTNKKQSVHLLQLKGMKCLKSPPPPSRNAHAATIQRWHTCKECGKGFSFACQLEVHMRWHTKEKPYSCTVCRKSFTTVSMLKRHHRIHTGEKPFACHVCGKRFNQSAHLNTHFRLHTRERASWSRAPFPRNPQSAGN